MSAQRPDSSECPRGIDAGAYALKALDADERSAYAEHVRGCDHCRLEVRELRQAVDALPLAVSQTAAPPALKGRLMAVVEAEAQLLRAAGPEADRRPAPAGPSLRRRIAERFALPLRPAFAGALACALLGLGVVGGLELHGSDGPATQTLQAWAQGPATAQLKQTGDKASLEVVDLPSLDRGQVYQVWFDRGDGQFRPTHTLFNVRNDGHAKVAIEESVKGVDRIAVTPERSGGALAPSTDPVVTASPV